MSLFSLIIICFLLLNSLMLIRSKVIFAWSPADLWGKVCSLYQDTSKQMAKFVVEDDCMTSTKKVCVGGHQLKDKF